MPVLKCQWSVRSEKGSRDRGLGCRIAVPSPRHQAPQCEDGEIRARGLGTARGARVALRPSRESEYPAIRTRRDAWNPRFVERRRNNRRTNAVNATERSTRVSLPLAGQSTATNFHSQPSERLAGDLRVGFPDTEMRIVRRRQESPQASKLTEVDREVLGP
jgi:hypothetical protein